MEAAGQRRSGTTHSRSARGDGRTSVFLAVRLRSADSGLVCPQLHRSHPLSLIRAFQLGLAARPADLSVHDGAASVTALAKLQLVHVVRPVRAVVHWISLAGMACATRATASHRTFPGR